MKTATRALFVVFMVSVTGSLHGQPAVHYGMARQGPDYVAGALGQFRIDFEEFDLRGQVSLDVPELLEFPNAGGSGMTVRVQGNADCQIYDLFLFGGDPAAQGQALLDWRPDGSHLDGTAILFEGPVSSFSLDAGDFGGEDDSPLQIIAFDEADQAIGSASAPWDTDIGPPFATLVVQVPGIRKVVFSSGGELPNSVFIDNLTFTPEGNSPDCGNGSVEPGEQCDEGNTSSGDCCSSTCGFEPAGSTCSDANACTTTDSCDSVGQCVGGAAPSCDDGNLCTTDACDPATGCTHADNSNPCDDGSACTTGDRCGGGTCHAGAAVVCQALDPCHIAGVCDAATGLCSNPNQPDGTPCDDGSLCTGGETCQTGICTPAFNGLNHPQPKRSGYYHRLCEKREHNQLPYQGDQLTDADALCVAGLTATFDYFATVDDICNVIDDDHHGGGHHGGRHHGGPGGGPDGKDCEKGEDELIATALNICRARVCEEQNLVSRCRGNTSTTVAQSFADADAILDNAARDRNTCKDARCELREINNGRALAMNSLVTSTDNNKVRLTWLSPVRDEVGGAPASYEIWRRPLGSNGAFVKIGATAGLTFLDSTSGTAPWEYEVTADVP